MRPEADHVRAAVTAARRAGLAVDRGEVARVAANVLVRLEPGPIAARLSGATAGFRDSAQSPGREVRLASALAEAGAPVVASLGILREAQRPAADGATEVAVAVDRALELLGGVPDRIVHGDSHPGTVLWTTGGPLWSDWEDAHLAPLEWDLACLVAAARMRGNDFGWAEAALDAHGGPYDAGLLEVCVDARLAQGAAYLAFTGRGGVGDHVEWLRRADGRPRGASRSARRGQ